MLQTIQYMSGATPIHAELFSPTAAPNGAVVVIAHGTDGVTDNLNGPWAAMMREYGTDLAVAGFTVLLPYYFEKTGTSSGLEAMQTMLLRMPAWQEALDDALVHAATLPGIAPGRAALIGFSLGGHLSLRLRSRVQVLVEFFAPNLTGFVTTRTVAPYAQIHHGDDDRLVPFTNAEEIEHLLKSEGVAPEVYRYSGAGHGFAGTDPNNTTARKLSKERTLRILASYL